jgi:Flp pilus assembly protein TadG
MSNAKQQAAKRTYRLFLDDESGASAAEFALVLPVVLILIFGAIASGVMMYTAVKLQHATETSARCLSAQRPDCDLDNITPFAEGYYTGPTLAGLTFNATIDDADCANGFKVTATGTFNWFAGFGLLSVPLGSKACYPGPTPAASP